MSRDEPNRTFRQATGLRHGASRLRTIVLCEAEAVSQFPSSVFEPATQSPVYVHSVEDMFDYCQPPLPTLVVLPVRLGGAPMLPVVAKCKQTDQVSVLMVAENDQIAEAAEAMRQGADDCLFHPFSSGRLAQTVSGLVKKYDVPPLSTAHQADMPEALRATPFADTTVPNLIAYSPAMQAVVAQIKASAHTNAPVLIHGEAGTGKSHVAQVLHSASDRASGPFVVLNCADMTAADFVTHFQNPNDTTGALSKARGGTLFLDHVDALDPALQTRLATVVEAQSDPETAPADAPRILAALSSPPHEALREGRVRNDFYYSLKVIDIGLPPLRERPEDIPQFAAQKLSDLARAEGRTAPQIGAEAMSVLTRYAWPGNLRELNNTLRALVLTKAGGIVAPSDLPSTMLIPDADLGGARKDPAHLSNNELSTLIGRPLALIERRVIEATIAQQDGSVPRAARILDVSPSTIYRKREGWAEDDAASND